MHSLLQQSTLSVTELYAGYKRLTLSVRILVWMVLGVALGLAFPKFAVELRPIGDLFIRLLLMSAIPLVFFNLISGISRLTYINNLGKLGVRTLVYYLSTTTVALVVGILAATLLQPGARMILTSPVDESVGEVPPISELLLQLVPENMLLAFSSGNVAQVVLIAVLLGVATLLLPQPHKENLQEGFALITSLLRKLVEIVLKFSPVGVACLVAASVGEIGGALLAPLAKFLFTIWLAQLFMVLVYLTLLRLTTGRSTYAWLQSSGPLYATTIATCSSLASLVVAMEVARNRLKLMENVYSFTLPLGTQLNKDGTAITLVVILLFTAQAVGIHFDLLDLVVIILVGLVLSEGSGGIPQSGLVLAFIFLQSFGLPLEIAGILAGIYRIMDMGNTTVNCMGDLIWSTIMSDNAETAAAENLA